MATPSSSSEAKSEKVVIVGSRSSQLAMIQTTTIVQALSEAHPDVKFRVETMKTIGDNVLDKPLPNIGQTNLFTKELETALAAGSIDLIVHSLKDLPTTLPPGMKLAVIYKRDSPTDALLLSPRQSGRSLETLPPGSVVGTSSLRRIAQLKRAFPELEYKSVRGNLNTRLAKLDAASDNEGDSNKGGYDALILATAGLVRMGWTSRIAQELSPSLCMYAVGQGALAIETREDDTQTNSIVQCLNDPNTLIACSAERQFLKSLGGGCSVPIGVESILKDGHYTLRGAVFSLDGHEVISGSKKESLPSLGTPPSFDSCSSFGAKVGEALAQELIKEGAREILKRAREETDALTSKISEAKGDS
ncbi:PREDICTED: uncharacterized protein LOC100632190 [Amphimedon queenslandica]|uniref:hydroxymethylbilane synthase n=1 Tax=Amphimedon queenslandica TaxID=400682 RepID=A0A1X7VN60_AMPQE|nr:PREDICTED: uncharacterized protein LOC100632190 [Amphimedon queenslandica]|eukprot:XP_003383634.1 PREDICTED: uncharacterized protein LOC100632190 [Amphimedon queenslandica]